MKDKKFEFDNIIKDIICTNEVQHLKLYKHHYGSNRLEHSLSVAFYSYLICKLLHIDYVSAARAGLLHDLFLYDCETKLTRPKNHIRNHPKVALGNAKNLFTLNEKECDIILKHMWPITCNPPKYLESYIVTFVDKFCALKEWGIYCKNISIFWSYIYFSTYKKLDFII